MFSDNIETLNFNEEPEECRLHINKFVEQVTKDNIKDLLIPGAISSATNIVVANAAYFKGQWVIILCEILY